MSFDLATTTLVAVLSLSLGVFVLARGPRSTSNRLFFALNLFTSLWVFSSLAARFADANTARPFVGVGFASAALMAYFFLLFCLSFPERLHRAPYWPFLLFLLPAFFVAASFGNLVAVAVWSGSAGIKVVPSPFYLPYSLYLSSFIVIGLVELVAKHAKSRGELRIQLLYVLVGFSLTAVLGLLTSLVLPLVLHDPNIYRWGIYGVLFFLGATAYAITKHHLFNIRVIVVETATVLVVLALAVQLLLSRTLWQGLVSAAILLAVAYGGYIVIRSVQLEIRRREELQELDQVKTEFVSLASHELLTPVSAIQGSSP